MLSDSICQDCPYTDISTGSYNMFYQVGPTDHWNNIPGPVVQSSAESEFSTECTAGMVLSHSRMLKNELMNKDTYVVPEYYGLCLRLPLRSDRKRVSSLLNLYYQMWRWRRRCTAWWNVKTISRLQAAVSIFPSGTRRKYVIRVHRNLWESNKDREEMEETPDSSRLAVIMFSKSMGSDESQKSGEQ